jgi:hypothetical protein
LGFLGASLSGRETPIHRYWISLDFLGFSRPNRDLSMGYTDFSATNFRNAFPPCVQGAGMGSRQSWDWEAQDCSWGKLNSSSDYQQAIVGFSRLGAKPERL